MTRPLPAFALLTLLPLTGGLAAAGDITTAPALVPASPHVCAEVCALPLAMLQPPPPRPTRSGARPAIPDSAR